ncbi:MAG: Asp-tRNA(Asn)/Glu-tRNA(Gln) amidotransferase subunit GatC [Lentisphaeraceae bacterium]|nr:Asp-tRNA(Asn)/Glu-tRNA(Gln) amidotransferase subunit GatC [Lentisphaeraceae bacterium]
MSQEFDVEHYARLSRLSLKEEDIPKLKKQMGDILDMVDGLSELDLEDIEGTNFAVTVENVIRQDVVGESLPVEKVVATFPESEDNQCKVPQVIEDSEGDGE